MQKKKLVKIKQQVLSVFRFSAYRGDVIESVCLCPGLLFGATLVSVWRSTFPPQNLKVCPASAFSSQMVVAMVMLTSLTAHRHPVATLPQAAAGWGKISFAQSVSDSCWWWIQNFQQLMSQKEFKLKLCSTGWLKGTSADNCFWGGGHLWLNSV